MRSSTNVHFWLNYNCKVGFSPFFKDHWQVRVLSSALFLSSYSFFRFWRCWIFISCCWLDITGTWSLQTFHSNWFVNITLHCLRHPSDVWGNVNIFSNGCVFSSVAYQLFSLLPRHSKAFHTCLSVSFFIWEKNCFIGSSVLLKSGSPSAVPPSCINDQVNPLSQMSWMYVIIWKLIFYD